MSVRYYFWYYSDNRKDTYCKQSQSQLNDRRVKHKNYNNTQIVNFKKNFLRG